MPGQRPTGWFARSCWRGPTCRPQHEQAMTTDSRKQNHANIYANYPYSQVGLR
jgi:hypothetical protein